MRRRERHGKHDTSEYRTWQAMIQRCTNPNCAKYPTYGARGISVCEGWRLFSNFYTDMGQRPSPAHSLDRINNDGNYEPGNCRWATRKEQQRNLSSNRFVTIGGESRTVAEWAEIVGVSTQSFTLRIDRNWPESEMLRPASTTPVRPGRARFLTHAGITDTVSGWAKRLGINHQTLHARLKAGCSVEYALTKRIGPNETRRRVAKVV